MYMNDIKIFAKNEKELGILIQTIIIYNHNIRKEFGREKYVRLIMNNGKREKMEEIELPNQENIRTLEEKENYKYLGIL